MDLRISHACPSCGAPVEMREADRLTACSFCDVQNYMIEDGLLRFVLPYSVPDQVREEDMLYFPYLRFKGNIYTCLGQSIGYKALDTTHQGLNIRLLPPSLGLRPQAMKVGLVDDNLPGRFIRRKETAVNVLHRAATLAKAFSDLENAPLYHRAFIGETVSCIYLPLYVHDAKVYDGVLHRVLGNAENWLGDTKNSVRFQKEWKRSFLATICPQCGDTMRGQKDSLVLNCSNCESCWTEKRGKFVPVPYRLVKAVARGAAYLPFWRITVESRGIRMKTLADFLKVTNQPVVASRKHQEKNLEFWVPAFKLRPKVFLKLAKSATLSQLKFPEGEKKLERQLFSVTLPLKEAVQVLKSVVAETTVNRKEILPKLPDLNFTVEQTALTYLPFEDTGHDLVQQHAALSVASSVLSFGRKL